MVALVAGVMAVRWHRHKQAKLAHSWVATENAFRDQQPVTRAIWEQLDVEPGMSVADIGAGGGYFTFRLAQAVGPEGHVVATEVDSLMLDVLHARLEETPHPQVSIIEVRSGLLGLQPGSVDRMLISNVYFFSSCDPEKSRMFFREARRMLRPGGRMVIMNEYVHEKGWTTPGYSPLKCGQLTAEEVIKLAGKSFTLLHHGTVDAHITTEHELPGYLLTFQRPAVNTARETVTSR